MDDELTDLLDRIEALAESMDIPENRRRDPRWLSRNVFIRNAEHPSIDLLEALCRKYLKLEFRKKR